MKIKESKIQLLSFKLSWKFKFSRIKQKNQKITKRMLKKMSRNQNRYLQYSFKIKGNKKRRIEKIKTTTYKELQV